MRGFTEARKLKPTLLQVLEAVLAHLKRDASTPPELLAQVTEALKDAQTNKRKRFSPFAGRS